MSRRQLFHISPWKLSQLFQHKWKNERLSACLYFIYICLHCCCPTFSTNTPSSSVFSLCGCTERRTYNPRCWVHTGIPGYMYIIYEQRVLLGKALFFCFFLVFVDAEPILPFTVLLLLLPSLSHTFLLSLFLVAISLFSVPRVPQSSPAEGDTIPWVELANELAVAKNSHSSLSASGSLHEWYLSVPVLARFFILKQLHTRCI